MMGDIKAKTTDGVIKFSRKLFYNTPVMKWGVTSYVYDKVFSFGMPDLSKPISFRGAQFFVDPVDRSYVPSMVGGYYEKHELDIFSDLAKHSKILFDIGGNIGMYSVLAASQNTIIKCFAFEPVLENQNLLQKNVELNGVTGQVTLVKAAVSNKNGTATIHLSDKLSGTHSLSVDRGGSTRQVKTLTVDSYCSQNKVTPDLIKIDVEGHEGSVFAGMTKCLKTKPTIFMEYIPELNKDMQDLLKELAIIYEDCFVVDAVKGRVTKLPIQKINPNKMYNIVLAKNKAHLRLIETHLTLE